MATTRKVLGQAAPAADTNTDLYTVPASTSTVTSTLTVCKPYDLGDVPVAVRPQGDACERPLPHHGVHSNLGTLSATSGSPALSTDVVTVRGRPRICRSLFTGGNLVTHGVLAPQTRCSRVRREQASWQARRRGCGPGTGCR